MAAERAAVPALGHDDLMSIAMVLRLVQDSRRRGGRAVWLSLDEIEAVLRLAGLI